MLLDDELDLGLRQHVRGGVLERVRPGGVRRLVEEDPFTHRLTGAERRQANGAPIAHLIDAHAPLAKDHHDLPRRPLDEEGVLGFVGDDLHETGELVERGFGEALQV